MPRKPRIELAGKYHIINRGVAQMHIFKEPADYEYFEELMCFYAKSFGITIHNYCLMGNHYHLLLEIQSENLSKFMPEPFLKMIVTHELAHLKIKEHNKAFYKLCEHMEPTYHQLEFDLRVYLTYKEHFGSLWS